MALKKLIISNNGIPLEYHRIAMIKSDTNKQTTILMHSYLNQEARQYEKDYAAGLIKDEPRFPYVDADYISLEYDPGMSISRAYDWIKSNLEGFEDAENVFEDESEEYDVSGEEFISMIEEVL